MGEGEGAREDLTGWRRERAEMLQRVESHKRQDPCYICHDLETGEVFGNQHVVFEDHLFRIVLDPYPGVRGQAILVFKPHRADVTDLNRGEAELISRICIRVVKAMKRALGAERVYVLTMSDGPSSHLTYQFIPRYAGDPMGFARFRLQRSPIKEGAKTARALLKALLPSRPGKARGEDEE